MRPRVGHCSTSAARSNEQPPPGRTAAKQQHIPSPNCYMAFHPRAVQFAQSPWSSLHTACRLRAGRPAWIVARTLTRPRSAMRRIVQSPTEGSTNGSNHGRLVVRSEEHTSELQSRSDLVCRLLLEKKKKKQVHI